MALARMFMLFLVVLRANAIDASCDAHNSSGTDCIEKIPSPGSAMLQMTKAQALQQSRAEGSGKQTVGRQPAGSSAGATLPLTEQGYQQCASLCCHHEMTLFVERVIGSILFHDVCDSSALFGLVHWYDCTSDRKTYAELVSELRNGITGACPWLGSSTFCPVQATSCQNKFPPCPKSFDILSEPGSTAALSTSGYAAVALRCCDTEMKDYIVREIQHQNLQICDKGALQGLIHWYDCTNDNQTYATLAQEIRHAHLGNPCPWLAAKGELCPINGKNCPRVGGLEGPEPQAHRRRTACR